MSYAYLMRWWAKGKYTICTWKIKNNNMYQLKETLIKYEHVIQAIN